MRVNERMKKLLSIALTLCMVLAYVPSPAGATGTGNHTHDGSYVAPENPECTCAEKCEEANVWCDVCRVDHTKCLGQDTADCIFMILNVARIIWCWMVLTTKTAPIRASARCVTRK